MNINRRPEFFARLRRRACVGSFGIAIAAFGQMAPTAAPTPAQLAKYDLNKNGVLDPAETAAMQADTARATPGVAERAAAGTEAPVELSPFEVVADSRGYFASNTLSGTRLNSKIEDLGASITVITKQQLLDLAAVDINDIFLSEANTEGTGQFTDQSVDFQGRVLDNTQASPQTSNRIRGLNAANISADGFSATSRIPIDAYNIDSVEISRGPNSNLSGLGDAGGTVNINQARANLTRDTTQLTLRGDDWGGFRASVDLGRPLLRDKLAVRVSAVYDSKGFRREPSADIQRRQFGAVTYKPFGATTITGSFESFSQFRRTPNALTPVDMVSEWIAAGRPTWDPITRTAKLNGVSVGVFPQTNENTTLPAGLGRDAFFDNFPSLFIDGGQVRLYTPNRLQATGTLTPANFTNDIRLMTSYTDIGRYRNTGAGSRFPLASLVGYSNKSLYDYENVNAVAANWNRDQAELYKLQLEQRLLDTPLQRAYAQVAWRLEDSDSYNRNRTLDETTNIYIDVNERLLDGAANPFFLRPYVNAIQRPISNSKIFNDTTRAQLSYTLDLRKQSRSWLAHLGRHQALGYYERSARTDTNHNYREAVTSDVPWVNLASRYASAHGNFTYRYYLGDNQGSNLDYGPPLAGLPSGNYPFRYATNVTTTPPTFTEQSIAINGEAFGGLSRTRTEVRTRGAALQSFFWADRIVGTFGYRKDAQRNRSTPGAVIDPATGFGTTTNYSVWNAWTYREGATKTYQGVFRPFNNWRPIQARHEQGGPAGYLAGLLDGLQFQYNRSDSFKPATPSVDLFGNALPNPNGKGKDYGFSVRTPDSKLVARVNWYETKSVGARLTGQFANVVNIVKGFEVGAGANTLENFARTVVTGRLPANATEQQILTALYQFVQLPSGFYDEIRAPISVTDVNDQLSKGVEIELNYNPSRNLRFKLSAAQTKAIDLSLIDATQKFIDQRMPVWTALRNDQGQLWWNQVTTNATVYSAQVANNLKNMRDNLGRPRTQVKEWSWNAITTYTFTRGRLNGVTVGSTIRWTDQSAIGFQGIPDADGIVRTTDFNRPVYDPARASYDFMAGYNLRFFSEKVRARIQLNCKDAFAHQGLRATKINPIAFGSYPSSFRILDGRQWILTTTFDL